jgi:hypothetical protein
MLTPAATRLGSARAAAATVQSVWHIPRASHAPVQPEDSLSVEGFHEEIEQLSNACDYETRGDNVEAVAIDLTVIAVRHLCLFIWGRFDCEIPSAHENVY